MIIEDIGEYVIHNSALENDRSENNSSINHLRLYNLNEVSDLEFSTSQAWTVITVEGATEGIT